MIRKCQKNNIQAKKKKHHQFVTEKLLLKNMNKKIWTKKRIQKKNSALLALIKNNYSTYDPPKPMFTINTQILYLSTNNTQLFLKYMLKMKKEFINWIDTLGPLSEYACSKYEWREAVVISRPNMISHTVFLSDRTFKKWGLSNFAFQHC